MLFQLALRPFLGRRAFQLVIGKFFPQLPSILSCFSVDDYLLLGTTPHLSFWESEGYNDEKFMKKSLKMCDIVNLSERKIESLSGGEMRYPRFVQ